jgi:cAMP phosphodiesterase
MKFRVLGCSGGQVLGHNLSGFLIDDRLLIDAGSATSALTLPAQEKITDVLITHIHLDHVLSLGLLADNRYGKTKTSINVWSTDGIVDGLKNYFFNDQIWPDFTTIKGPTQPVPVLKLRRLPRQTATRVGGYSVTPVDVDHIVSSVAFFIKYQRKTLLHIGDTGPTAEVWAMARNEVNLGAIVIETSFPNRLQAVADASRHLTPRSLAHELKKLGDRDIPILVSHLKPQFRREIIAELKALKLKRLRVLKDGDLFHL